MGSYVSGVLLCNACIFLSRRFFVLDTHTNTLDPAPLFFWVKADLVLNSSKFFFPARKGLVLSGEQEHPLNQKAFQLIECAFLRMVAVLFTLSVKNSWKRMSRSWKSKSCWVKCRASCVDCENGETIFWMMRICPGQRSKNCWMQFRKRWIRCLRWAFKGRKGRFSYSRRTVLLMPAATLAWPKAS